ADKEQPKSPENQQPGSKSCVFNPQNPNKCELCNGPLVGEDSLPQERQAIGIAGLVRGEFRRFEGLTPHRRFLTLS
ncbi:hypothetical protein, partial [Rhizobium sp. C4]|uniref:hypothetical protein n=1 Tax=Rhizobium sp. C4 TaxID=1349800 RepID=UPI001E5505E3